MLGSRPRRPPRPGAAFPCYRDAASINMPIYLFEEPDMGIAAIHPLRFTDILAAVRNRLAEEEHQDTQSAALIQLLMDCAHAEPLQVIKAFLGNNEALHGEYEQPCYVYLMKRLLEDAILHNIDVTAAHMPMISSRFGAATTLFATYLLQRYRSVSLPNLYLYMGPGDCNAVEKLENFLQARTRRARAAPPSGGPYKYQWGQGSQG